MANEVKNEAVEMTMGTAATEREHRDLGFGSIVSRESRLRLINPDGTFNVHRTGFSYFSTLSFYHAALKITWTRFLLIILVLYFTSNVVFGTLYMLCGAGALVDTSSTPLDGRFQPAFFFSVQTFATIGYGTIHPVGVVPNLLVTIESYYSLLINALITGLVFARFARPTAHVRFSENALVAPYQDGKAFMFRLVNMRDSQLIEVSVKVLYAYFTREEERVVRRFEQLELERDSVSFFPLSWTVVHAINENSPLFGLTAEDLEKSDAEFLILLNALDETFAQPVHARSSYKPDELVWNAKFVNMYNKAENDQPMSIDVRKLSKIEKIES